MRPEAFSDKYYSARTILYFILSLCCYIGNDSPLSKRRNSSDSPTRKLIEHKTLKTKGELQLRNQTHIHPKTTSELFNKLAYNYSDADDWYGTKSEISELQKLEKSDNSNERSRGLQHNKNKSIVEKKKKKLINRTKRNNNKNELSLKDHEKIKAAKIDNTKNFPDELNEKNNTKTFHTVKKCKSNIHKRIDSKEQTDKLIYNLIKVNYNSIIGIEKESNRYNNAHKT